VFTGLVAGLGEIVNIEHSSEGVRLHVNTQLGDQIKEGDSVSVNGVCLTATRIDGPLFSTDVMNETLRLTSLGEIRQGTAVNLELAMSPTDRFGGHIVQGHVDGVGRIAKVTQDGFSRRVTIAAPDEVMRYVVHKGSITVDGISLTVAETDARSFTVSLIPETLERTNLGAAEIGTTVNLEVDVVAKYVERLINR
jgi:riboflavin synthase